jgi:hypothetical protein
MLPGPPVELSVHERRTLFRIAHGDAHSGTHDRPGHKRVRNHDPIPAFTSVAKFHRTLEGAMQRERTPVEARGGVISGRIITVLAISIVGAVIAMAGVWAIVGLPT